jgi:hypothetical protein
MADNGDEPAITAAEFETWLPPRAALVALKHLHGATISTIYERLRFGHIKAIARRSNYKGKTREYFDIPHPVWNQAKGIAASNLWVSGDITIYLADSPLALFGVRFDPAGIQELSPRPEPKLEVAPEAPASVTAQASESDAPQGPPVPQALLEGWHELYVRAYQGAADTEDIAVQSARGMFPGRFVARQRVRNLRGQQRRGRKSRSPNF